MVKVKSINKRILNLGIVEGSLIYFKPGEVKVLPDTPGYSDIIVGAVDDGFLEIILPNKKPKSTKKTNKEEPVKERGKVKNKLTL